MGKIALQELSIPGVWLIETQAFADARGFFQETYHRQAFAEAGLAMDFVQDNHSYSVEAGTLRGLHFQTPPFAQAKLVRVAVGRIWDVAVDLRRSSPTFGRWTAAELSAENRRQLFVPEGFAHAFLTLAPDTEVLYKVTNFYSPSHDSGVIWNDPDLAIDWPLPAAAPVLSAKDAALGPLKDAFTFP
ncbi:MAG: dTDP-4-dehydrorhamnose 3,5-epimerase [Alphaproteobacteria bacterium]|nr:dTDP-4-dehydrorhamnose 3,5-epimerase [Alphaproteobacteria bacterium]